VRRLKTAATANSSIYNKVYQQRQTTDEPSQHFCHQHFTWLWHVRQGPRKDNLVTA